MLATLNGTLRDDEGQACQKCKSPVPFILNVFNFSGGEIGHRKYDCPQIQTFNAGIVCRRCGQNGHFAKDCKVNLAAQPGYGTNAAGNDGDVDTQIQELMAEIGGGGNTSIGYGQPAGRIEGGQPNPWQQSAPVVASVAPWVRPFPILPYFRTNRVQKAAAPWATQQVSAPPPPAPTYSAPPPPPGMASGGISSSFGPPPSLGPPPGLAPGMSYGGMPPPPPMGLGFPPPPGGNLPPPPPPPGGMYPPPPPPQ